MNSFNAKISIQPDHVVGEIHEHLYGTNLEHVGESVYGGIWSEMLKSSKFEGPDPVFVSRAYGGDVWGRNPNHGVVIPWKAVNPDYEKVIFDHDNTNYYAGMVTASDALIRPSFSDSPGVSFSAAGTRLAYTGPQSQKITIRESDGLPHGVSQSGLYLEGGRDYQVRLVLRGEGQPVMVRLADQSWTIPKVSEGWETYTATMRPSSPNQNEEISITIQAGTLWIGRASLMPGDNIEGFRADAIAAIKASWTPTFLRWPGGNFVSSYNWMDGVGDRDRRPAYLDPAWQLWETNDVGTDEFIALCRLLDTEPLLTLNMGTGTVQEAAAWVEYCNGSIDTPYGAMRAANGRRDPYNVRTWFVGNEQFGNWQDGHSDAETYARRYLEFARAIREVDPDLTLIGVGVPTDQHGHWNERVLKIAGEEMDMLSVHWYSIRTHLWQEPPQHAEVAPAQLAAGHENDLLLQKTIEIVSANTDPFVPIAFDEWNTYIRAKPPLFIEDYNLADGLYTGVLMNACIRLCDRVKMSAGFNFTNVMGNYRITPQSIWRTPATLVLELLTSNRGTLGVSCQVQGPFFATGAIGLQQGYDEVPTIDAAATFDTESRTLFLSIANLDLEKSSLVQIEGIDRVGDIEFSFVTADSPVALNTESNPDAVKISTRIWQRSADVLTLPPLSFSVIPIALAR